MKKKVSIILLYIISSFAFSQNWVQVGLGAYNYGVGKLYADTVHHLLYAGGHFKIGANDTIKSIAKWNGSQWDSLGPGLNYPYCQAITLYNNELYVGGGFTKSGNLNTKYVAKWNSLKWDSVGRGVNSWVFDLHTYNNDLYIGGMFSPVDTTSSKCIVKRNNNIWYGLGNPLWALVQVKSIQNYNGDIYAAGSFNADSPNILRWDGNSWHSVGNGIEGSSSFDSPVNDMLVYNGELYIAGNFVKNANAGNNIMKWNGINFSDVGGGTDGEIRALCVFHNELYAVGAFSSAGGVAADNIAKWDGSNWCGLGSDFYGSINTIEVFNDELYIGGGFSQIDSQPINYVAKWIGGGFVSGCGNTIGINEYNYNINFSLYPNPTSGNINLAYSLQEFKTVYFELFDIQGKKMKSVTLNPEERQFNIENLNLENGVYFYSIIGDNKNLMIKKLVVVK